MGEIVDIDGVRVARVERTRAAAELAAMHPALRWVAGETYWMAHRRTEHGGAACGAAGSLMLASPGVPLCRECFPAAAREQPAIR